MPGGWSGGGWALREFTDVLWLDRQIRRVNGNATEGSTRDYWKCQLKQKKQPYRKRQPLGGNPRTNPVHKIRKCHRVETFTFYSIIWSGLCANANRPITLNQFQHSFCLAFNWCGYWWKRCSSDVPPTWRNNPLSARCIGPLGFTCQFQWCHVAVLALKLWNCFNSSSFAERPYQKKNWIEARQMKAKAKALVLAGTCAGLGNVPWDYISLIFHGFFICWSIIFLSFTFCLLPHGSDRFRHCWY